MSILAIDLGGTKLAAAVFTVLGDMLSEETVLIGSRTGNAVGELINNQTKKFIEASNKTTDPVQAIGISVPGISREQTGTVWAPNIPGWEDYPLLQEIRNNTENLPVIISGDRNCYIAGEHWKGNAQYCNNAIYIAVGTGIGAGILAEGKVLNGANNVAGAIGWMALERNFITADHSSGYFESMASGTGIVSTAKKILEKKTAYTGVLKNIPASQITAHDLFSAYANKDEIAVEVFNHCIELWGMATANLISIFNPEKIIFGGGIFGPAIQFIPAIEKEARKWAQPISMQQVSIEATALGYHAGLYGAAWQALHHIRQKDLYV